MRHLCAMAIVLAAALPMPVAFAGEQDDIEAACVTLGLPAESCSCIAEDTMKFEQREREVIYLSLKDPVSFEIMMKAGQVTPDEIARLNDYQAYIEPVCKVIQ